MNFTDMIQYYSIQSVMFSPFKHKNNHQNREPCECQNNSSYKNRSCPPYRDKWQPFRIGGSSLVEIDVAGCVLLFFNSNSKNGEVTSLALNLLRSIVDALLKNLQ